MEIAIHIRSSRAGIEAVIPPANAWAAHFEQFYPGFDAWSFPPSFDRLYIGDEFCPHRMPEPAEIEAYCSLSTRHGMDVTLLTPLLTDEELDRCTPLFSALAERMPRAEVVINDWGVLSFLKEKYPSFRLAAGRVLNKGFKDPRLDLSCGDLSQVDGLREFVGRSTFARPEFHRLAQKMGIERLESDLLPYGDRGAPQESGLGSSIYFPFGYITSGRVCWIASFHQPLSGKFAPAKACAAHCRHFMLELHGSEFRFQVFQNGNTLFYLYTESMMRDLMERASRQSIRLVYQKFFM